MRSPARLPIQGQDYRLEDSDPPVDERRSRLRFPFQLRVSFRTIGQSYPVAGMGRVVNISSNGVLIAYQHEISAGTPVELNINWPARLDGRIPLQLVAIGTVVRGELFGFAVGLERYHFRTAGKQDLPGGELFGKTGEA